MWKVIVPVLLTALFSVGSAGMVGSPLTVNLDEDEGARSALKFAVVQHNRGNNGEYLTQPAEVVSITKQLVAGYKYIITVKMGVTPCKKNEAREVCTVHESAPLYQCVFTVWSRPWMSETVLKEQNCS